MLAEFKNAFYDKASLYPFEQINQQKYVVEVLRELKKMMPKFEQYNFVFFSGNAGMEPEMTETELPHKILIQWEDQLGVEPSERVMNSFEFVFKTHLRCKSKKYSNLFSYPLGIPYRVSEQPLVHIGDRKYSVFFAGNLNDCRIPFYQSFLQLKKSWSFFVSKRLSYLMSRFSERGKYRKWNLRLKSLIFKVGVTNFDSCWTKSIIRFTRGFQAGFSPEDYSQILSQSKIVLSPCGFFNTECFRFYEAMRQGCIVVTEPLPKTDYYDAKYYIEVKDWTGLNKLILELLSNPVRLESMSVNAKRYYDEKLSPKGVAQYIMSKILI